MHHMLINPMRSKGFTIVELLVVMSVLGILMALVFGALSGLYDSSGRTLTTTAQNSDSQTALRFIEKDVIIADRFLTTNAIVDPAASTPWVHRGATSNANDRVLILSSYATTVAASVDTANVRQLIYTGGGCDQLVKNNLIYFVKDGTLYRRTIKNPVTPLCGGVTMAQKQSCPVGVTLPACQAKDAVVLQNVVSFSVDYFLAPSDVAVYSNQYASAGASTIESASTKTIKITLKTSQNASGGESVVTNSFRMTRQN